MNDDKPETPQSVALKDNRYEDFQKELDILINKHSLEDILEMPAFLMAELLVNFLRAMRVAHAQNDSWHGMKAYPDDSKVLQPHPNYGDTK